MNKLRCILLLAASTLVMSCTPSSEDLASDACRIAESFIAGDISLNEFENEMAIVEGEATEAGIAETTLQSDIIDECSDAMQGVSTTIMRNMQNSFGG